jgi:hypothetical protein
MMTVNTNRTPPGTASLPGPWCTSGAAFRHGRLRLVHTKSLLNFLSEMDNSNIA